MPNTWVRFGFGIDDDIFLSGKEYLESGNNFINTNICFASYLKERAYLSEAIEHPVYYQLACNIKMLDELMEWINSLNSGIKIELLKTEYRGALVNYKGTDYSEYVGGERTCIVAKNNLSEKEANKLGGLLIHDCYIKITTDNNDISKSLLEYIILVTIRILDYREEFLRHIKVKDNVKIINEVVRVSNLVNNGHSIYDVSYDGKDHLSVKMLEECLSVNCLKSKELFEGIDYLLVGQTSIIKVFLGKDKF